MCECTFTERLFCHVWFSHGTSQGPRTVSIGNCHLAVFLLASQLLSGIPRRYNLFYWASKLPSGTFPAALKTLKPPSSFAMGLPEAPRTVSVGNCHLAVFLLGFEAAIWHLRRATTCFYWASKLPSGTFPAALKP